MDKQYNTELLQYFSGKPDELFLYQCFASKISERFLEVSIKVQKTQITFSNRHNFAFASLPYRKIKGSPNVYILITFGLSYKLESPRIAVSVEPYPNRWTHHVIVAEEEDLDEELMGWIEEAYHFSAQKR